MSIQETFVVNLIPEGSDDKMLDNLKAYFYTHDFKFTNKGTHSRPHLTIGKFYPGNKWEELKKEIERIVVSYERLTVPIARVSHEITQTAAHPNGEGWVALVFDSQQIKDLYYQFDDLFTRYEVNGNADYIEAIQNIKGKHLSTFDCIANHINICNRCRPERVAEARDYILDAVPSQLTFGRIIVRNATTEDEDVRLDLRFKSR